MSTPNTALIALAGIGAITGLLAEPARSDGVAEDPRAWTETSMKHRAMEDFDLVLGQETWRPLTEAIELFGTEFPVEFILAMKFEIDTNGDGEVDRDVRGETGFVDLKGEDENGEVFHYGVRFRNEGEKKYSWAASGAMVGKVEGLMVSVVDANANGAYDDHGVDGLVIGSARGAGFVSKVLNIDGKLFEFEISKDGTVVKTRPYEGETGKLKVGRPKDVKAGVTTAIVKGDKDVYFQLAGETRGVEVPVGAYRLAAGFLERGSETARVRTGRMDALRVESGAEVELEWGGPLVAEIPEPRVTGDKVTIRPNVQVFGTAGEEYFDFQPKGKVPTYEIADAKTGKRLKTGKFPAG